MTMRAKAITRAIKSPIRSTPSLSSLNSVQTSFPMYVSLSPPLLAPVTNNFLTVDKWKKMVFFKKVLLWVLARSSVTAGKPKRSFFA